MPIKILGKIDTNMSWNNGISDERKLDIPKDNPIIAPPIHPVRIPPIIAGI